MACDRHGSGDRDRRARGDAVVAPRTLQLLRRITELPAEAIDRGVGAALIGQGFLMARPMPAADLAGWAYRTDETA